jgi:hypothetical protein
MTEFIGFPVQHRALATHELYHPEIADMPFTSNSVKSNSAGKANRAMLQ